MEIVLNYSEGTDHKVLLKRIDFANLAGPLMLDMENVPFFKPATLSLLYGVIKLHSTLCPSEERKCVPSSFKSVDTDVNRYVQRVNFFNCCPDFEPLRKELFSRHDPAGRFVPITEISDMHETNSVAEKIVKIIFSKKSNRGEAQVKYILTELMDNALQHSESPIGCIVQTQLYAEKFVEGIILDCGIGIRRHLSRNRKIASQLTSDEKAIETALKPYVSGVPYTGRFEQMYGQGYCNQGLGLSVCSELMKRSGGFLQVISGKACVKISAQETSLTHIAGWPGTAIVFNINCQELANISDIIKEFDRLKSNRDNLAKGFTGPEFF